MQEFPPILNKTKSPSSEQNKHLHFSPIACNGYEEEGPLHAAVKHALPEIICFAPTPSYTTECGSIPISQDIGQTKHEYIFKWKSTTWLFHILLFYTFSPIIGFSPQKFPSCSLLTKDHQAGLNCLCKVSTRGTISISGCNFPESVVDTSLSHEFTNRYKVIWVPA